MAAFGELDWSRIDVQGIVAFGGLATIDERRHRACREWLARHGYLIDTFDGRPGLSVAVRDLGRLLCWEERFGYALGSDSRNLDGLRDGFEFDILEGGGRVFEILGADRIWREDSEWLCGLLEIAQEQSRRQLALGRRFFALLVASEGSPLIGAPIGRIEVPVPFWSPCLEVHEFSRPAQDCASDWPPDPRGSRP
jgi:hypothetical protein